MPSAAAARRAVSAAARCALFAAAFFAFNMYKDLAETLWALVGKVFCREDIAAASALIFVHYLGTFQLARYFP